MPKKNVPETWDKIWNNQITTEEDLYNIAKEEKSVRWQNIEKQVLKSFGAFNNLSVVEIGAGAGTNAALFAKKGARVTILDYSPKAIKRAKEFFGRNRLSAKFVLANALNLPNNLIGKFDVTMSFGLAEHFAGEEREKIIKAHFDLLASKGVTFISVPNAHNPFYRAFKFLAQNTRFWKVGEEYPFSRNELATICQKIGIVDFSFFGDCFWNSLTFVNPVYILRRLFKLKDSFNLETTNNERPTILDPYFSYALVLFGKR